MLEEAGLPAGRGQLRDRGGRLDRRRAGRSPADALHRLHRLEGGRPADQRARRQGRSPARSWLKRTVLEMGGKDAIVVDETADLDAAAEGVVASAFGFQGQKCSACSRAIIVRAVYDALLGEGRRAGARASRVGDPASADTYMGPVIDEKPRDKIIEYIEIGKQEGRLVLGGEARAADERLLRPADDLRRRRAATRASRRRRSSGRCWPSSRPSDFDDALEIANNTEYGLTGARLLARPSSSSSAPARVPRRQPVPQPQVHRRDGRRAPVRRLQHERHRLEGRRPATTCCCSRRPS